MRCTFYKKDSKLCTRVLAWLTLEKGTFASADAVVGTPWCKPSTKPPGEALVFPLTWGNES
jgi:hypothetical protein